MMRDKPTEDGSLALQLGTALALLLIASTILNSYLFPALDGIFVVARDISTYCGAAFFFALALISHFKPRLLAGRVWTAGAFAFLGIGSVCLTLGVQGASALLVGLGAPLGGIGGAWFLVLAGVSFTRLSAHSCAVALVSATCVDALCAAALCFVEVPFELAVVGYLACYVISYVLVQATAHEVTQAVRASEAPAEADVTNPFSFLPLTHPVYIAILLFNVACGCALTFQPVSGEATGAPLACVPIVVLLVVVVVRRRLNADALFYLSTLLVLAGFLLVPTSAISGGVFGGDPLGLCNAFLQAGSSCFGTLTLLLMASIGSRNLLAAFPLMGFSQGMAWLGVGVGATLGQAANALASNDPSVLLAASALVTFTFVVYGFVVLRDFSFEETIRGIRPVEVVSPRDEEPAPADALEAEAAQESFEERCRRVAAAYKLTSRETDVFVLMAHGRTSSVIEERLVLSRNTIKTHVRNIYNKLGVHSQQELIDVVERFEG